MYKSRASSVIGCVVATASSTCDVSWPLLMPCADRSTATTVSGERLPRSITACRTRPRSNDELIESTPLKNGARSGPSIAWDLATSIRKDACSKSESMAIDGSSIVASVSGLGSARTTVLTTRRHS